jgi:Flp pilus assembly protein TadG
VELKSRKRGHAALEFALGCTVLVALFTGAYQFGYIFFAYESLLAAVRNGARYGAISVYDVGVPTVNSSPASNFTTSVRNVTVFGNPQGAASGAQPVVPGLLPQHVTVDVQYSNSTPHTVTVRINGFTLDAAFRSWRAVQKPSATFLYMGRYDPPML